MTKENQKHFKNIRRMKYDEKQQAIILDENSWEDAEWWYEDEPEVYEFMRKNEEMIRNYATSNNITIKNAIEILFKNSKEK